MPPTTQLYTFLSHMALTTLCGAFLSHMSPITPQYILQLSHMSPTTPQYILQYSQAFAILGCAGMPVLGPV